MKAVRPPLGFVAGLLVLTVINARSALDASEIHIFSPFNIYPSPTCFEDIRMAATSEPIPDSVNAPQPIFSPLARGARKFSFCASVPHWKIVMAHKPV